ncbi:MAG: helix-turn-helix domain-containing protein [Clostridia bacterium]|nr:helix-turn-helix domain-containing protein [Clostridia bacterium]
MFQTTAGDLITEVSHKLIDAPKQSVYFNHIHNHAEILLFLRGEANYNIDGQLFTPAPRDLLFIPSAIYHYLIPTANVPYENYVIGFSPSIIDKEKYDKLFSAPLMISAEGDEELLGFFSRLDLYFERYERGDFERCVRATLDELLTYLYYKKRDAVQHILPKRTLIDEIVEYVSENIERPIDAVSVAEHLHLSKSYVQNLFSQNMHIGLKKYIMQKKIYSAHADIKRGLSPSLACEKYAFGDYSTVYRLYKSHFGASPKERNF